MSPRRREGWPALRAGMALDDYRSYYWMKAELVAFARELGLSTAGYKPELAARIERRLEGLPDRPDDPRRRPRRSQQRDSDAPLTRATAVVNYFSDAATRAFFTAELGPGFHFTYRLNQFRLARQGLTYGDLIDEWKAEHERRQDPGYQPVLASHGKWNLFVRAFFADPHNKGRSLANAAAEWKLVKAGRGDFSYKPRG